VAYGFNVEEMFREIGVMAGKVLKGTKPADLPAERPARFELVVNLKAAKALRRNSLIRLEARRFSQRMRVDALFFKQSASLSSSLPRA